MHTAGQQGWDILSSPGSAGCFIVLPAEAGNLPAGAVVDVQLLEGLI